MNCWQLLFWPSVAAVVVAATIGAPLGGGVAWSMSWIGFVQLVRTDPAPAEQPPATRRGRC
jgi:hypothetical protein